MRSPELGFENQETAPLHETSKKLREGSDKIIGLFCNKFEVEGKENLIAAQEQNPDSKFIILSSHTSNLDAPAAIKALGDRTDIQITFESVLKKSLPHKLLFGLGEEFSPLEYKNTKEGKQGTFNPDDFSAIQEKMDQGKTPWMALHGGPGTVEKSERGKMQQAKIGAVYLAHKTGAKILPTAMEIEGKSGGLEGVGEFAKGLLSRAKGEANAVYHIGQPIELQPLDISIIETVLDKRKEGEKPTKEELEQFKTVHQALKEEAERIAQGIAQMLPESQRGKYTIMEGEKKKLAA